MPDPTEHLGKHPPTLRQATKDGMLLIVRCGSCGKVVNYLASDLVEIMGGDRPARVPPCRCGKCRTTDFMKIELPRVYPGDILL